MYSKKPLPEQRTEYFVDATQCHIKSTRNSLNEILDKNITLQELNDAIKQLKRGKAVGEDLLANEFFKASTEHARVAICNLFNECLKVGAYPWSISHITPIHKKGCIYDPENYRAIAIASNLGKLFPS